MASDHSKYKYLAITFRSGSTTDPDLKDANIPGLKDEGQIGELASSHRYSIPLSEWDQQFVSRLKANPDIVDVQVLEAKQRVKRTEF